MGWSGMTERAQMYGGDVMAGPLPGRRVPCPGDAAHVRRTGRRRPVAHGRVVRGDLRAERRRFDPNSGTPQAIAVGVGCRARSGTRRVRRRRAARRARQPGRHPRVHADRRLGLVPQDRLLSAADRPAPVPGVDVVGRRGAGCGVDDRRLRHRHRGRCTHDRAVRRRELRDDDPVRRRARRRRGRHGRRRLVRSARPDGGGSGLDGDDAALRSPWRDIWSASIASAETPPSRATRMPAPPSRAAPGWRSPRSGCESPRS